MKKIIIFLCAVSMICLLALPSLAAPVSPLDPYGLLGTWYFKENPSIPPNGFSVNFYSDGDSYTRISWNSSGFTYNSSSAYSSSTGWTRPEYRRYITITGGDALTDQAFATWLKANATEQFCDESSCPATDTNADNICDDCGMTFAVLRDYGMPDPYTVWTEEFQNTYPYALVYTDNSGNPFLILCVNRPYYEKTDSNLIIEGSYRKYTIYGTTWRFDNSGESGTVVATSSVTPSFNLLNSNGTLAFPYDGDFFPKPLWEMMEEVTQGGMETMAPAVGGTMKVLALCGVGLIACLAVLKLFGKRSLIFRG